MSIHCGVGIADTLNAVLMFQLDLENATVYENSMSDSVIDAALPTEVAGFRSAFSG
ncbi:MAG: hypothetical protein K2Y51_02590 [Gammaproteobacteria bacterium]|nr:hypothetical protein [Gammaproteobacteria bacterium]